MNKETVNELKTRLSEGRFEEALALIEEKTGGKFLHPDIEYARAFCKIRIAGKGNTLSTTKTTLTPPQTGSSHSPFTLAVQAQTTFHDGKLASARAAIDELARLEPSKDIQHNAAIIHALEGEMKPLNKTSWHEVMCTAIGHYIRGESGAACACVVEAEKTLSEEVCEERNKARAVALAAAQLVQPTPKLPFTAETIQDTKKEEDNRITNSWHVVFEAQENGHLPFSSWPHCAQLPQALRERAAMMLAPGCTRAQLITLSHHGLASPAAVVRARELGDEGLALSILAACIQRPSVTPASLIDTCRAELAALHQPRARVRASKTGHQGAAADRTTSASALAKKSAGVGGPKRRKGKK